VLDGGVLTTGAQDAGAGGEPAVAGYVLGTDIGGTFTDVVLAGPDGQVTVAKRLTTQHDPAEGLLAAVRDVLGSAGASGREVVSVVHGTTLATNVILERRGVDVAFVTTRGFASLLTLGRHARVEEERYDLFIEVPAPPVPPWRCFEVGGRIGPQGEIVEALDEAGAARVAVALASAGVEAVAICLLHSYANAAHEQEVARLCVEAMPPGTPVVASSALWPQRREYERATTTVMSAYVGPVMTGYLARVAEGLRALGIAAPLQVMDSAGGAMTAELAAARAVHTIESGPAAGVVAAQQIARSAGRGEVISLDMGGTTAKAGVIRNGRPDITHEFHVGGRGSFGGRRAGSGVPIKTPTIDLAEVGSGGGSVAWIDPGGTLQVGPRSAGSRPGPACYGLGGHEPCVTDADLLLGYLNPRALAAGALRPDIAAAEEAVARHLAGPLGVDVTTAAAAVHDVANAKMGDAVHVVTVQRGIDPRGYALVALGGAAPLHAARIAEGFGIGCVLVPERAGVASAAGLLSAELSAERARSLLSVDAGAVAAELDAVLVELAAGATADLGWSATGRLVHVRSVDVRFRGQSHELSIPLPEGAVVEGMMAEVERRFHDRYRELFGIDLRAPIEVVSARVRTVARRDRPPVERLGPRATPGSAAEQPGAPGSAPVVGAVPVAASRRAWFTERGGLVDCEVRPFATWGAGEEVRGPLLVDGNDTTLVVPPGWRATMRDDRTAELVASAAVPGGPGPRRPPAGEPGPADQAAGRPADELGAAVLRNALAVAAEEAGIVVVRSAYSTFIVEGADAAAAILDADGRLVAGSVSTTLSHSASLRCSVRAVLERFPPSAMSPGDLFVMNDVYEGGIHANDLMVFRPVFVDGQVTHLTGTLIHVADLSGLSAGGLAADAADVFLEGVQLPPVRLATAEGLDDDLCRILAANSRQPDNLLGDLRALVAGANVAAARLQAIIERHGFDRFRRGVEALLADTARRVGEQLGGVPDGTYRGEYPLDAGGSTLVVRVAVVVHGQRVTVDFTGTDPQVPIPVNAGFSQTMSGAVFALRCFLDPTIPMNEGCFDRFDFVLPPGSLVNVTRPHPGGGRFVPVAAAEEAIIQAMSDALPARAVAPSGILQPFSIDGGSTAPRPWLHMAFDHGGMGARRGSDGPDASGSLFGLGRNIIPQVEPIEARLPLRVESVALIADSGGAGQWRGGLGTRTVLVALEDANVDTRGDRLQRPPPGRDGGGPGRSGGYYRRTRDGGLERLAEKATRQRLLAGEALVVETSGGGGLGPPSGRDPAGVAADLASGRVSPEGARRDYGIAP